MQIPAGFELKSLEIFINVAQSRGMTQAAKVLDMSQSSVSQHVANLESALGVTLLDRSVRPPALTNAGKTLYAHASHLVVDAQRAVQETQQVAGQAISSLRMAMIDSFAAVVGPHIVQKMKGAATHWCLWSGLAPAHSESLLSHRVDLVVSSDTQLQSHPNLRHWRLLLDPYVVAVPEGYSGPTDDLQQLNHQLTLVRYSQRSMIGRQVESCLRQKGILAPMSLEFDTADAQLAMIASGVGWGITTPLCLIQSRASLPKLRLLPLDGETMYREIFLAARDGELGDIPERITALSQTYFRHECFSALYEQAPWLKDLILTPKDP